MAPVSDRSQANRHFLDHQAHQKSEHHKWKKKSDAEPRAGGGIGKHARGIVLAEKNEHAGSDQKPEYAQTAESFCAASLPARAGHAPAVSGAIQVLVSEQAAQFARGGRRGGDLRGGVGGPVSQRAGVFLSSGHELTELNFTYKLQLTRSGVNGGHCK